MKCGGLRPRRLAVQPVPTQISVGSPHASHLIATTLPDEFGYQEDLTPDAKPEEKQCSSHWPVCWQQHTNKLT